MGIAKNKLKIAAVVLIIVLIGLGFWKLNRKEVVMTREQDRHSVNPIVPVSKPSENKPTNPITKKYKDGTYSADGKHMSPAGEENISISLMVKDDIITDATFTGKATNPKSKDLQGKFAEGFKQHVIGKSIDSISLTVVNGSSLTPKGFMDALSKIKDEARN